jgi:hypothetical protein
MPRPLKVFRTAIGFRDAYVAAPSRAAALRAWGTEKDLFARGGAEEVTDPELTAAAIEKPGEVVYKTRGGLEEQVAALGELPKRTPRRAKGADQTDGAAPPRKLAAKPKPRPSRAKVEEAEVAIARLEEQQEQAQAALKERERALAIERSEMKERFARKLEELQQKQKQARADYEAALRKWNP